MSLLLSDITAVCRSTLLDPSPGLYWTDADFIYYGTQAFRTFIGWKPDLNTTRVFATLAAGSEQSLPTDGMQFLDAYVAGNGQAVMVLDMQTVKHAKFANLSKSAAVADVKVVASDPRQPKKYWVFPRSTGSASTLEILYAAMPSALTAIGDAWPLPDETQDAAYNYIMALAYKKQTDRTDLNKSAAFMNDCRGWFDMRNKAQFGEAPKADQ